VESEEIGGGMKTWVRREGEDEVGGERESEE
jgi:hypothetical protein